MSIRVLSLGDTTRLPLSNRIGNRKIFNRGVGGGGPIDRSANGMPAISQRSVNIMFKKMVLSEVTKAVRLAFPSVEIPQNALSGLKVDLPRDKEHGEFSVAVFPLAKALKLAPPAIALKVKEQLELNREITQYFEVSVIGPYINFKFSPSFLLEGISRIDKDFGKNETLTGQKIMVEFVSANPTGPLHIGHGRWAVLGDSICRLFEACGAQVTREFYVNDAGGQIERFVRSVEAAKKGEPIPEDGYHGDYIYDIAKQEGDPVQLMIEHQKQVLASIGVVFDFWFSEKTLYEQNKIAEVLDLLEKAGLTYKAIGKEVEEGDPNADKIKSSTEEALWLKSTNFGDEKDRVLVRGDGKPTYITGDAAYHLDKIQRGFDLLINIFGADHHGYVARLSAVIQALSAGKQAHQIIIGQLVKLLRDGKEAKMSKRGGTAIMLHDLVGEIGSDAVRVYMGSAGFDTSVNIDLDVATAQTQDNPVYYLQYAHARICQIFNKAALKGLTPATLVSADHVLAPEERDLLVHLFKFPDQVNEAAGFRNVSNILRYTIELASLFHSFYSKCIIIDENQPETSAVRLAIVLATKQMLLNAFGLLGISAPDEMKRNEVVE